MKPETEAKFLEQFKEMIGSSSQAWYNGLRAVTLDNDRNAETGKPYHGYNVFILAFTRMKHHYKSTKWITFIQCQKMGGHIKKGEHSVILCKWGLTPIKKKEDKKVEEDKDGEEEEQKFKWYLNAFPVYNIEQTTLTDDDMPVESEMTVNEPISMADEILGAWDDKPEFIEVDGTQTPCYSPMFDTIKVPNMQLYKDSQYYYMTLFHECIHSTGAKKRLARDSITKFDVFGSDQYAKEELVAETGASLLGAKCGFDEEQFKNAASYVKSWLSHTEESMTQTNFAKVIVSAFSKALAGYRYILGIRPEHETEKEM